MTGRLACLPENMPGKYLVYRLCVKLSVALLFFFILKVGGDIAVRCVPVRDVPVRGIAVRRCGHGTVDGGDAGKSPETDVIAGNAGSILLETYGIGIKANLVGCTASLIVVYFLRFYRSGPMIEFFGALSSRLGVPIVFIIPYIPETGLSDYQAVFRDWTLFYIVIVYLVSLPLDVWLVLPENGGACSSPFKHVRYEGVNKST